MPAIAKIPSPPYYAVIFTAMRTPGDNGYGLMAREMVDLEKQQEGFLGAESLKNSAGYEITISYWTSLESIRKWKEVPRHVIAQEKSILWYSTFASRVCKVERDSFFPIQEGRRVPDEGDRNSEA